MNKLVDHIYVINMKKDIKRLNKIKEQLDPLHDYEIIEGVDTNNNEKYKKKYDTWKNKYNIDITFEKFDWIYYINRYPDLKDNGINTKIQAWNHYIEYGRKELRSCNIKNDIVNSGQWGCLYSHINVLRDALKKKYEKILILEDDIILTPNYQDKIEKLYTFLHNKNNKWLTIYLGASQHNWKNITINDGFYFANKTTGTFAYMIHKNFYKILIKNLIKMNKPVDNHLVDLQEKYSGYMYVIYPNIIVCDLEESNIGEKRENNIFYKKFRWDELL